MKKEEFVQFYSNLSAEKRRITRKMLKEKGIDFASFPIGRRPPETTQVGLSFSQQRLWFLDKLDPHNPSYNIPTAVRLLGALDLEALGKSFDSIVRRHEALRTSFDEINGVPIQIVLSERGMPLPLTDLSNLSECERQERAQALVQNEAKRTFDLATDPLIRGGVIRLSGNDHILYVTLHHIVSDGWSIGVLIKEMTAFYGAYVKGEPPSLPDLPVQYGDFAYWQRDWMSDEVLQQQLTYWSHQLEGLPPLLKLPLDRPRPTVQTHSGATLPLTIPPVITANLHAVGKQAQATLFMTLAAAFNVFLARYSGQDDIALGTVIANRNRPEIEGLIGFFTNTLVLRTRVDESLTFLDLLHQLRDTALGAYANQDVPFEQLFEVLRPERDTSHSALFQVMMVLHNTSAATLDLPGLTLHPVMTEGATSKFDLSLYLTEGNGQLNGGLEYNTDLFEAATVQRMARHFMRLLAAIADNPRTRIVDLPLLEADDTAALKAWNETSEQFPQRTLGELFEAQAARTPEHVAVVDTREELSYAELNRRANQLAHRLRAVGVGPERRVAICLERSSQMIVALLAILKAGGAYVPLDPANPSDRLSYLLADSRPDVLVTQEHLCDRLPSGSYSVLCLDVDGAPLALAGFPEYNPAPSAQPDNAAYVIYTSGTSGGPKGVINTHRNVVNHVFAHAAKCGLATDDRVLQFASLNFDASVEEIFPPLIMGATVVVRPADLLDTGAAFAAFIEKHRLTVLDLPTAFWHTWTSALEAVGAAIPRGVRLVIVGGEKARLDRLLAWRKLPGAEPVRWMNTYGPTETTISVLTYDVEQERLPDLHEVPIGRPLSNIRGHVLDRHLRPVPVGVVGELYISGAGLARGYLDRPALTAERFVPNAFGGEPGERAYRTGDLARYRPDGTLEYAGRADSQIKLRGFRIELGEVEAALAALPSVREAAVLVREYRPGDLCLVAYVSLQGDSSADANDLRMALQRCLPDYMVPSAFVLLDCLPLNASGKLDRRSLPAPSSTHGGQGYVAASTTVEEMLVETWKELLHLDKVGVHDNFFHLGGHSLLATQLVSKVRDSLGVELPLRTLFEHPTVAGLARNISAKDAPTIVQKARIVPVDRSAPVPLSFAQQRMWFLDQMEPSSALYTIPVALTFEGDLDAEVLAKALNEVVRRHEVLRMYVHVADRQPIQCAREELLLPLERVDLSNFAPVERRQHAHEQMRLLMERPFDLTADPLIRAVLLQLEPHHNVLLLTLHHIVADGWSMAILERELRALYDAFSEGNSSPLAQLPLQYADYASWQRQWLQGDVLERQVDYWRKRLAGAPDLLDLPLDHPRAALQSHRGAVLPFTIPGEITAGLLALSERHQASLFMTLTAAFTLLLSYYTGQDDICLGTPIANRTRSELEPLIGLFVNTLVLRTEVDRTASFENLLDQVRSRALEAYAHQDVPFEHLVEVLNPPRHASHTPLFQAMIALQNTRAPQAASGYSDEVLAKFDLSLNLVQCDGELQAAFDYAADLFEKATIGRMARHFTRLLALLVQAPATPLNRHELLDTGERKLMLSEWNQTDHPFPSCTAIELFAAQAQGTPDRLAVVAGEVALTYAEVDARANQVARALRALGVGPDVLVGLCLDRTTDLVIGLLGVWKAGGAYVPLDPRHPPERAKQLLSEAQPVVVLVHEATRATLPTGTPWLDMGSPTVSDAPFHAVEANAAAENLAYVIFTSGSSGKPKGVAVKHSGLVNLARSHARHVLQHAGPGPLRASLNASITFDAFISELLLLVDGHTLHVLPDAVRQSAEELHAFFRDVSLDVFDGSPMQIKYLLEHAPGAALPPVVLLGGEAIDRGLWERLKRVSGTRFFNAYGPTECTVDVTIAPVSGESSGPVIGRPEDNIRVYVLDHEQHPVPLGVAGELYVGGPGLARGYLGRADLSAAAFVPDPFTRRPGERLYRTGDRARYLSDGSLAYVGRMDGQVKLRGFRVELGEVEAVLAAQPGVKDACVLLQRGRSSEQLLVGYVVSQRGENPCGVGLRRALQDVLPEYMVPARIAVLTEFPRGASGKLNRNGLPMLDEIEKSHVEPRTPTEAALCELWAEVLGIERVGVTDDFFQLGGHSLSLARMLSAVRTQFGVEIALRSAYTHPTVEFLAASVTALHLNSDNTAAAHDLVEEGFL